MRTSILIGAFMISSSINSEFMASSNVLIPYVLFFIASLAMDIFDFNRD